jgi:adenylyl- and sulfurtransferase ThiI
MVSHEKILTHKHTTNLKTQSKMTPQKVKKKHIIKNLNDNTMNEISNITLRRLMVRIISNITASEKYCNELKGSMKNS